MSILDDLNPKDAAEYNEKFTLLQANLDRAIGRCDHREAKRIRQQKTQLHDNYKVRRVSAPPENDHEKLERLKTEMLEAISVAEKAAYAYFCECDVGPDRSFAHDIYETIRNSTRRN